jgi:hypothetical protein
MLAVLFALLSARAAQSSICLRLQFVLIARPWARIVRSNFDKVVNDGRPLICRAPSIKAPGADQASFISHALNRQQLPKSSSLSLNISAMARG